MNQFSPAATTAVTVLRVLAGFVFAAHGWQKFSQFTIAGTQASFAEMGVPAANIVAPLVATLELAGGIALILGVLITIPRDWKKLRDAVEATARELGMHVEIDRGTGDNKARGLGRSHVTVIGSPLKAAHMAAVAGRIEASTTEQREAA